MLTKQTRRILAITFIIFVIMPGISTAQNPELNTKLNIPLLGAMDILNHLPARFPDAISLAPGKPADEFCSPDITGESIEIFKAYAKESIQTPINRLLGQYGKINGIINELISKHLKIDEDIETSPENIIVTVGFQEAATLCVLALFNKNDVLLVPDPGYIGVTGIAALCGVNTEPVKCVEGLKLNEIKKALRRIKNRGKAPKAIYVATSYCNPQGSSLSLAERKELLLLAKEFGFYIIEDATYNLFNYDEEQLPSLKSLDKDNRVIYIGSFAKTIYPALRIGYIVFDGVVNLKKENEKNLIKEMIKIKSFLTINTPALDQAVVGGFLLKNNYSLKPFLQYKKKFFKKNLEIMLSSLKKNLSECKGVTWTHPKGGFFLTITLPFNFTNKMLEDCARNYKVIVLPMYLLSLSQKPNNQVRLSFTTVSPDKVKIAVENFSRFIKSQISQK